MPGTQEAHLPGTKGGCECALGGGTGRGGGEGGGRGSMDLVLGCRVQPSGSLALEGKGQGEGLVL